MKLALNPGLQTYQILTKDDKVCIPSLSSILLAVIGKQMESDLVHYFEGGTRNEILSEINLPVSR